MRVPIEISEEGQSSTERRTAVIWNVNQVSQYLCGRESWQQPFSVEGVEKDILLASSRKLTAHGLSASYKLRNCVQLAAVQIAVFLNETAPDRICKFMENLA